MTQRTCNVLFLCTGNSARSILAEALLQRMGGGRFKAFSAGSFPKGAVHPMALALLNSLAFPTEGLASKSWEVFAAADAPRMDLVLTVCDQAAGEVCPIWPGQPATAHWGIPDPAAAEGSEASRMQAFREAFARLEARISRLVAIDPLAMRRTELSAVLAEIGRLQDAPPAAVQR